MVDARSVITTSKFMESKMELPVVLGKTISNEVFVTDLAKMPHLINGRSNRARKVGRLEYYAYLPPLQKTSVTIEAWCW